MSAIVLDEKMQRVSELALPQSFEGINPHNLYLYVKSFQAAGRANSAKALTRADLEAVVKSHGLKKAVDAVEQVQNALRHLLAAVKRSVLTTTVIMI